MDSSGLNIITLNCISKLYRNYLWFLRDYRSFYLSGLFCIILYIIWSFPYFQWLVSDLLICLFWGQGLILYPRLAWISLCSIGCHMAIPLSSLSGCWDYWSTTILGVYPKPLKPLSPCLWTVTLYRMTYLAQVSLITTVSVYPVLSGAVGKALGSSCLGFNSRSFPGLLTCLVKWTMKYN